MTPAGNDYNALVQQAMTGHMASLELLLQHHRRELDDYIQRQIPADARSVVDADDILQDVCFDAFRRIQTFRPQGEDSFVRWLLTIARHRIIDAVRHVRSIKRGGDHHRVDLHTGDSNSAVALLQELRTYARTPSSSAISHELAQRLRQTLAELPQEHRQALELRYLEDRPVADVATTMHKSEGAIHMLCHRGLRALRLEMLHLLGT